MNGTPIMRTQHHPIRALRPQAEKVDFRAQLWRDIATVVARADSARADSVPAKWADAVLEAYDRRFPQRSNP